MLDEIKLRGEQRLTLDEMYDIYLGIDENLPIDVHLSMFIPLMMHSQFQPAKTMAGRRSRSKDHRRVRSNRIGTRL